MVKKKTIGKVQIGIGVVLMVLVVIGAYNASTIFNNMEKGMQAYGEGLNMRLEDDNISNETRATITMGYSNSIQTYSLNTLNLVINISLFSIIGFFISLLFITQGLVNLGHSKNG